MMISFDSVMKTEKLAVIGLVIIIAVALSAYLVVTYGDEIFDNLTGSTETIEIGDCADVHYTGSFENGTVFDTSYGDVANDSGIYDETRTYEPLNIFASLNATEFPPEGYETYFSGIIEGFMEGLIGLKEGETKSIGPIPPEKAYGVYPKIGDEISIIDPETEQEITIVFVDIQENASMPEEYIEQLGNGTTTLFVLKFDIYSVGDKYYAGSYPSWGENATVVTKTNETMMWYYTTPPEDLRENFTWIDPETVIYYWENASSVTSMNNSTIVVTHTPEINATMDNPYLTTTYTVMNVNDTKINVSYDDGTGNISYDSFNRTVTIERNQTYDITFSFIREILDYQLLQPIKQYYDPDLTLSVHELAGKTLYFEVEIVKLYKTSQQES